MQAIFKKPDELIINGADNNERALLNSYIEESAKPTTKVETTALYDINANVSGMSVKVVETELPKIKYFDEPIIIGISKEVTKTLKTDPEDCTVYANNNDAKVCTVVTANPGKITVSGNELGNTAIELFVTKEGYETLNIKIPVEVVDLKELTDFTLAPWTLSVSDAETVKEVTTPANIDLVSWVVENTAIADINISYAENKLTFTGKGLTEGNTKVNILLGLEGYKNKEIEMVVNVQSN